MSIKIKYRYVKRRPWQRWHIVDPVTTYHCLCGTWVGNRSRFEYAVLREDVCKTCLRLARKAEAEGVVVANGRRDLG